MLTSSISPEQGIEGKGFSPLIAVVGPTGSGKSQLGLVIAEQAGGEIVNYDSVQVYRGLDIGSAKLPAALRRGIRHHLLDILDFGQELTAGAWANLAREVLATVWDASKIPVFVGGTGFYLRALLDGLSPAPGRDRELRARLGEIAARRPGTLHRFLRRFDRPAAKRIHPNDLQKLIRAIELTVSAGRPASETQSLPRQGLGNVSVLKIGLMPERAVLYRHLDARSADMFRDGLLDETDALLRAGAPADAKPLNSLGYKQAVGVLTGATTVEQAIFECQTRTRQYAKRQLTWFRRERNVHWLQGFGSEAEIQNEGLRLVQNFLNL